MVATRMTSEILGASVELITLLGGIIGIAVAALFVLRLRRDDGLVAFVGGSVSTAIILSGGLTALFSGILVPGTRVSDLVIGFIMGVAWTREEMKEMMSLSIAESRYKTAWRGLYIPKGSLAGLAVGILFVFPTNRTLIGAVVWIGIGVCTSRLIPYIAGEVVGRLLPPDSSIDITVEQYWIYQGLLSLPFVTIPYISRFIQLFTYSPRYTDAFEGGLVGFAAVFVVVYGPKAALNSRKYIPKYILLRP